MVKRALRYAAFCVVAMVLVALMTSSFAHRFNPQIVDPEIVAYVQAGGALADICGDPGAGPFGAAGTCEACLIAAGCFVPSLQVTVWQAFLVPTTTTPPDRGRFIETARLDPSRSARAPPAL